MKSDIILSALLMLFIFIPIVSAECIIPIDNMEISEDTIFCTGEYYLPNGVRIVSNNVTLDCNGAVLNGANIRDVRGINANSLQNDVTIKNCVSKNYWVCIGIYGVKKGILLNNQVYNCGRAGINGPSDNSIVSNNYMECGPPAHSQQQGINIGPATNVLVSNNTATGCFEKGFFFVEISNSTILNNVAKNNGKSGFMLANYCNNNIFSNNEISSNGVSAIRNLNGDSYNNLFFHNNFINNPIEVEDPGDNLWFNMELLQGNYWNNYDEGSEGCYDSDLNGICDNPYVISIDSQDNFPFIEKDGWLVQDEDEDGVLDENDLCTETPENEGVNVNGCSCSQIEIPFRDCSSDSCVEENFVDYPDDGFDTCVDGEIVATYSCEPLSLIYDLQCDSDDDNDGILDEEDKCPNTIEEQIIYGCSCEQILELKPGNDTNGKCSLGIINVFTNRIGWASNLFG